MKQPPYKYVVIIGPTASGKSDLAIAIAKKYDGEIISADSRQVYRGMDKGTGKVPRDLTEISNIKYLISNKNTYFSDDKKGSGTFFNSHKKRYLTPFFSEGIRHHLIDVASPRREYNISQFLRDAKKAISDIEAMGKLPIICGGTNFWVQTLLSGQSLPEVKPNKILRDKLEKKSAEELFKILSKKDPRRAETIDRKNKYRLVRALEIIELLGKVPLPIRYPISSIQYPVCIIALNPEKKILRERIRTRLEKRFADGMIEEVRALRASGISWKRLEGFGLEYRYIALFLQGKISGEEMKEKLFFEIWHYAKRQLSFIRRMEKQGFRIHWIEKSEEAQEIVKQKKA